MRTLLTGEFDTATAWDAAHYVQFEVQNASGTWIDVGAALGTHWIVNARWGENIDQSVSAITITLVPFVGGTSMSPLMAASPLNVDDAAAYAPLLEIGRLVRVHVATMPAGVALDAGKYRPIFDGRIDVLGEADSTDGQQPITVQCSDSGAWLMDIEIESTTDRQYGTSTPPGTALETVLQSIIDDNIPSGEPAVTLYKQSSSTFAITPKYTQSQDKLLPPLVALVLDTTGEDLRYRYDASHVSRLTWFNPDRGRTSIDATFGADGYVVQQLDRNLDTVRNAGRIPSPAAPGTFLYNTDTAAVLASRASYRRHFMQLAASPQLTTDAQALSVLDAAINDNVGAPVDAKFLIPFGWFVQLFDRYTFTANGRQYDSDQTLAVVQFEHSIESGRGQTVLSLAGRVIGAYAAWRKRITLGGPDLGPPNVSVSPDGSDDTGMDVTITATPGAGASGTPLVSYRVSDDAGNMSVWSGWFAAPLALHVDYLAKNNVVIQPRALQSDGQITEGAGLPLRGRMPVVDPDTGQLSDGAVDTNGRPVRHFNSKATDVPSAQGQTGQDAVRVGRGGLPTPDGEINTGTLYSEDGTTPYVDTGTGRVTASLAFPGGLAMDTGEGYAGRAATGLNGSGVVQLDVPLVRAVANVPAISGTSGKALRTVPFDGGDYAAHATDAAGNSLHSGVGVSTGTAANRLLAKPLSSSPDTADSIADGLSLRITTLSEATGGGRGFSGLNTSGDVNRNVPRGFATANVPALDTTSGLVKRGVTLDDGSYAARTSDAGGLNLDANSTDSSKRPVRILQSKATDTPSSQGQTAEGEVRMQNGGLPTFDGAINTQHVYSADGTKILVDVGTQEITSDTAIGPNVRGDSSVVFGDTTKFAPSRHVERRLGANSGTPVFAVDYENVPDTSVIPTTGWVTPAAGSSVDIRLTGVTVAGGTIVATSTASPTFGSPASENPSTTLNGSTAASQVISTSGGAAYWDLAHANSTSTTFTVTFDVNTTGLTSGLLFVVLYTNNGTSSTSWVQVANKPYDLGVNATGETLSFDAAMHLDWDVRMVVTLSLGGGTFSVTAKACTYTPITGGAVSSMSGTFLVTATEPS